MCECLLGIMRVVVITLAVVCAIVGLLTLIGGIMAKSNTFLEYAEINSAVFLTGLITGLVLMVFAAAGIYGVVKGKRCCIFLFCLILGIITFVLIVIVIVVAVVQGSFEEVYSHVKCGSSNDQYLTDLEDAYKSAAGLLCTDACPCNYKHSTSSAYEIDVIFAATNSTAPADSGNSTAPADSGNSTAPADSGNSTAPADSGNSTAPADSGNSTAPADGGNSTAPADGGNSTAPADSGNSTAPANSGNSTAGPMKIDPNGPVNVLGCDGFDGKKYGLEATLMLGVEKAFKCSGVCSKPPAPAGFPRLFYFSDINDNNGKAKDETCENKIWNFLEEQIGNIKTILLIVMLVALVSFIFIIILCCVGKNRSPEWSDEANTPLVSHH